MRRPRLFGDRLAEPLRQPVEARIDRLVRLGLFAAEHVGHGGDAALHFRLRPQKLGKAQLRHRGGFPLAGVAAARGKEAEDRQQAGRKQHQSGAGAAEAVEERGQERVKGGIDHAATIARIAAETRS